MDQEAGLVRCVYCRRRWDYTVGYHNRIDPKEFGGAVVAVMETGGGRGQLVGRVAGPSIIVCFTCLPPREEEVKRWDGDGFEVTQEEADGTAGRLGCRVDSTDAARHLDAKALEARIILEELRSSRPMRGLRAIDRRLGLSDPCLWAECDLNEVAASHPDVQTSYIAADLARRIAEYRQRHPK